MAFFSLALVEAWNSLLALDASSLYCSYKLGSCSCFSAFGLLKDLRNQLSLLFFIKLHWIILFPYIADFAHRHVVKQNFFNAAWALWINTSYEIMTIFITYSFGVHGCPSFTYFALGRCLHFVNDPFQKCFFKKVSLCLPKMVHQVIICSYSSFVARYETTVH